MGRGRQKAKQTKVARELKYHTPNMDVDALRRELSGDSRNGRSEQDLAEDSDNDDYGDYRH
jgi:DUF3073 family protein